MKIVKVNDEAIIFDNGNEITFEHCTDCCEWNYADCEQLDDLARVYDFNTKHLFFEAVEEQGFRFGDNPWRMFFVPCYSSQNGYYSSDIDIYLNGEQKLNFYCKEDFC